MAKMSRYFLALHPNVQRHHVPTAGECVDCLTKLDGSTGTGGRPPEPLDFTVCAYCGCLLRYDEKMLLRRMNEDELDELSPENRERILAYHRAFRNACNEMAKLDGPKAMMLKLPMR